MRRVSNEDGMPVGFGLRLNCWPMFAFRVIALSVLLLPLVAPVVAQDRPALPLERRPGMGLKRTRLYLKDGSFQVVLSYEVRGDNVFFLSAERGAEQEIIPLRLVDLDATRKWEQQRDALQSGVPAVKIDPELAKQRSLLAA